MKILHTDRPSWNVRKREETEPKRLAQAIRTLALEEAKACKKAGLQKQYQKIAQQDLDVLAGLLLNRGISDAKSALKFLTPQLDWLHDWRLLQDIEPAMARLKLARGRGEKVLIHGDYDADGITATALLMIAFKNWGIDAQYYLPHRIEDGYGLSRAGILGGHEAGCTLLVTVDCGISNYDEVEYAKELGMDVIITDHHLPPEAIPAALAVVNPKRHDSKYPFSELAGVGLAWKLASALELDDAAASACLQLAALGTVADLVPLVDENRVLVSLGLEEINANPLTGIAALAAAAGCEPGKLDSTNIAFNLAPRLNAAGRMDSADAAVSLLLETDPAMASALASGLDQENQRRRNVEEDIFNEAYTQAAEQAQLGYRVLVLHGQGWHQGVVGIVASKILDRFYRPAIVLSGEGMLTGSARSVDGFDIHAALSAVSQHLDKFGGHPGAAGLSLQEDLLETFRDAINQFAVDFGIDPLLQPVLHLEGKLGPQAVGKELVHQLELLHPFGFGNPEPVFAFDGFSAGAVELVGRDKSHLRLRLDHSQGNLWAIGFGKASLTHNIDKDTSLQVAGTLKLNRWNGRTSVQLQLFDLLGPNRAQFDGRYLFDRRQDREPWLTQLAQTPGTIFFANTISGARRLLGAKLDNCNLVLLPPDNYSEKVYNLKAGNFCFLEPAWNPTQLREIISLLPAGSQVHFFGTGAAPEDVLRPNLNLLRSFYKGWRESSFEARAALLSLLPDDLADPVLLDRILTIFAEAGLAGESQGQWKLVPVTESVNLTETKAWSTYTSQLEEYQNWLAGYLAKSLDQLLA